MNWLRNDLLVLVLIVLIAVGVGFLPALKSAPVEASGGPGVVMCVKTATTGDIDVWLCEPLIGPEFIINSVGFMQVVE